MYGFSNQAKQSLSNFAIATGFWDAKGILLVDFMEHGTTITYVANCDTLKRLRVI